MSNMLSYGLCSLLIFFTLPSLAKQKVLIIESYHSEFVWDKNYKQGIQSVLKDDFELFYFEMNSKRIAKSRYQERANQAWQFYQEISPDLVILGDDNALSYLGVRFSNTLTPVIYLGINNNPRHYNIHHSKNISGVLERPLLKRAIPAITKLLANKVSKVLLLFDKSLTSQAILEETFSARTQMSISNIDVQIRLIGNWERWKNTVLSTANEQYDAIFLGTFHTLTDINGQYIAAEQVIEWTAKSTPIPPFGLWDFSVGENKTIGGLVLFGYEQGKMAAEMAREVLENGKQPYQLGPRTAEKGSYLFSRQGLQTYGITLPQDIAQKATFID